MSEPTDALWLTYYYTNFNPARFKVKAMQAEMPKKYWRNMPEAALIPSLIAGAPARVTAMAEQASLDPPPFHLRLQARRAERDENQSVTASTNTLPALREAALGCTRCPLHCHATQTVFGEGPETADLMIVGEQPGDREDLAGRPFVGPSGQLLEEILIEAGIDRSRTYVTNAVKHFKHEPRGKRRLHKTPNTGEIERCRWWLDREIEIVRPKLVVAMGATALLALTGEKGKLADRRGRVLPFDRSEGLVVTVHPAYLLRLPDPLLRQEETIRFRADFAAAGQWLAAAGEAQG
jgi:DNA polymerase